MTTSDTATSAHTALREATQALRVRRDGATGGDLTDDDFRTLAADLSLTLDAVVSLLRSVGVGVRPNAATHGLLTVAEHVDMGALMARQASGDRDEQPKPVMHLEPERCGCTDD
ncbi:hypothetical protein [Actinomycetospora sp. CA-053990]|uniref:hypothetical protein n=1 Tax=Actinomycetospora sp. CA-053990 TaxID=3239891 RepID=UPI003D913846